MQGFKPVQILLVEDNPDDVEITRRALRKGCVANDLQVVRDGQEALDFLFHEGRQGKGANMPRPALILLDLNLPKVSGLEVLERVRTSNNLSAIPVIILTVSDRDEDAIKGYELGANTYIQKPVEFDKFMQAMEVLEEYWLVIAKLPPQAAW
jgi:CheY-like chemotaxis protein